MRKYYKKIYLLAFVLSTYFQKANAETTNLTIEKTISIISIGFILIGFILIIMPKFIGKKDDTEDNINKKATKKEKTVSLDAIFKELPTFSANKFHQDIFETIKKEIHDNLSKDEMIEKITLVEKEIIDFHKNNNEYTIISKYKIKYLTKYINEKNKSKDQNTNTITCSYTITSKNDTNKDKVIVKCPTCFGKLKDPNKLRCEYCDCILPANNETKEKWIISEIEMDNA